MSAGLRRQCHAWAWDCLGFCYRVTMILPSQCSIFHSTAMLLGGQWQMNGPHFGDSPWMWSWPMPISSGTCLIHVHRAMSEHHAKVPVQMPMACCFPPAHQLPPWCPKGENRSSVTKKGKAKQHPTPPPQHTHRDTYISKP